MKEKTIYTANGKKFAYKKNAKAETPAFYSSNISAEEFEAYIITSNFEDTKAFLKNNPNFLTPEPPVFTEADDLPEETEKPDFEKLIFEMQEKITAIEQENKTLKESKLTMSFEDAQKLYLKKSKLLEELGVYSNRLDAFLNLKLESKENLFSYDNVYLSFNYGDYNAKEILKTSNKLIIKEFVPFIIEKLRGKIAELKKEIETFEV